MGYLLDKVGDNSLMRVGIGIIIGIGIHFAYTKNKRVTNKVVNIKERENNMILEEIGKNLKYKCSWISTHIPKLRFISQPAYILLYSDSFLIYITSFKIELNRILTDAKIDKIDDYNHLIELFKSMRKNTVLNMKTKLKKEKVPSEFIDIFTNKIDNNLKNTISDITIYINTNNEDDIISLFSGGSSILLDMISSKAMLDIGNEIKDDIINKLTGLKYRSLDLTIETNKSSKIKYDGYFTTDLDGNITDMCRNVTAILNKYLDDKKINISDNINIRDIMHPTSHKNFYDFTKIVREQPSEIWCTRIPYTFILNPDLEKISNIETNIAFNVEYSFDNVDDNNKYIRVYFLGKK